MLLSFRSFRAAITVLALTALPACSSSKKDDPAPTIPVGMSWSADGAAVSTTTVQSQKNSTTITLTGTAGSTTLSTLLLEIPTAVGTHAFSPASVAAAYYSGPSRANAGSYYAGPLPATTGMSTIGAGTIVVAALTATNVTGTFTFTGIGMSGAATSITNGTFNVGL